MLENGSPVPTFDFDEARSYFRVVLPAHPEYVALSVLRTYAYKHATGDVVGALQALESAWKDPNLKSPAIAVALARGWIERGELERAKQLADELPDISRYARVITTLADALFEARDTMAAQSLLDRLPALMAGQDAVDAAITERRLGRQDRAHARSLHEFAQTKMALTGRLNNSPKRADQEVRRRLLNEASEFLERVLQMEAPATRHAWAALDLAKVLRWLNRPP